MAGLTKLLAQIQDCTVCERSVPPLPHRARPVCVASHNARIRIIGQAPGKRVHESGIPFTDPSGVRLRDWLGVTEAEFYNPDNFAITPMGFCFPGYDKKGADLPPRQECAPLWQSALTEHLDSQLTLLVGSYAVKHHLGAAAKRTLTETVQNWQAYGLDIIPLPHPSWRNNGWIKKHDWFGSVLAHVKRRVDSLIER